MASQKHQLSKQLSIDEIKDFIRSSSNLDILRTLEVCIKQKRDDIVESGQASLEPFESIATSNIRGTDYLYIHKRVKGKTVSRKLKDDEFESFDFGSVKISKKAKQLLREKYKLDLP
jgi:hypothetical protein